MTIAFYELQVSRPLEKSVETKDITRKWIALRDMDETVITAALEAFVPVTHDGLNAQGYTVNPLGGGAWMCDVRYAFGPLALTITDTTSLGPEFSFDITAAQVHITQSLRTRYRWQADDAIARGKDLTVDASNPLKVTPDDHTVTGADVGNILLVSGGPAAWTLYQFYTIVAASGGQWTLDSSPAPVGTTGGLWTMVNEVNAGLTGAGGSAPDFKQGIGVTTDSVQGTDVFAPKFEFQILAQVAPFTLTTARTYYRVVAKTNNAPWKGFDTGEVMYLGGPAQCTPGGVWTVAHKFAASPNQYGVPVSIDADTGLPDIVVPFKGGWEYLWAAYKQTAVANKLLQTPDAAYVEQVSQSADFTLLGLGS